MRCESRLSRRYSEWRGVWRTGKKVAELSRCADCTGVYGRMSSPRTVPTVRRVAARPLSPSEYAGHGTSPLVIEQLAGVALGEELELVRRFGGQEVGGWVPSRLA